MLMTDHRTNTATPLPCPFCARTPKVAEQPASDAEGGGYLCFIACFCDGFSACAHKMARGETADAARADAIAIWNRRAAPAASSEGSGPAAQGAIQEPVAWQARHFYHDDETWSWWYEVLPADLEDMRGWQSRSPDSRQLRCLYAAPVGRSMDSALRRAASKSSRLVGVGVPVGQAEDAARYRWLRDEAHPDNDHSGIAVTEERSNSWGSFYSEHLSGPELDTAIDAARLQAVQSQPGDAK
jgi:hypothetical protein